jgi:hypothetical protein
MNNYQQHALELFNSVISDEPITSKLFPELGVYASVPSYLYEEVQTYFNNKLTFEGLNNSFYKSWEVIESISDEERYKDQIVHYFTVYVNDLVPGLVEVYLPKQEAPVSEDRLTVNYVGTISGEDCITRCIALLNTPSITTEKLVKVFEILKALDYEFNLVEDKFSNKEAQCLLYDYLNVLPVKGEELFRYLFYKATNTTLVVNNVENIHLILNSGYELPYLTHLQLVELSKRFLSLKEIWVAGFKKANKANISTVNKLNKLAKAYHTPKQTPILLQVTSNPSLKKDELIEAANTCTVTQLIKAINALRVYMQDCDSKLYRIRNGKSWIKDSKANKEMYGFYQMVLVKVLKERLPKVSIHHEPYISYSLNLSDKQKVGHIPTGTKITIPEGNGNESVSEDNLLVNEGNLYVGIHWYNPTEGRMDLDLRADSLNHSVGWNSRYGAEGMSYTGDMTNAPLPLGATEWFKVNEKLDSDYILKVNNFTDQSTFKFKLLIGYSTKEFNSDSVMQLDNVLIETEITSSQREYTIGLLTANKEFYFLGANSGNARVGKHSENALNAAITSCKSTLRLNDIFTIVDNPTEADIDLSLNKLAVDSFNFIK